MTVNDIVLDQAESVAAQIRSDGGEAIAAGGDVSLEDDVPAIVAACRKTFGDPTHLISNAGHVHQARFTELTPRDFDRMFAVHVRGAFLMTRAVLPAMLARNAGVIVYTASQLGQIGGVELVHYSAAKAAIIGLTKSLAREVSAQGVRRQRGRARPYQHAACSGTLARVAQRQGGGTAAWTIRRAGRGRGGDRLSVFGSGKPVRRADDRAQFRRRNAVSETVLITGAGIGIGRATAKAFASRRP